MSKEKWNILVFGVAGMVYNGLQKLIKRGLLPFTLNTVSWDENFYTFGFKIKDTIFDYSLITFDQRPLVNRIITGATSEYFDIVHKMAEAAQNIYEGLIRKILDSIEFTISYSDSLKFVGLDGFGYSLCGFLEDVELSSSTNTETAEEKLGFKVILNTAGAQKLQVIKLVMEFANISLKEASDLVNSSPVVIKEDISEDEAESFKNSLEELGAEVEIN